eukprot:TRINITY_DN82072_c0_g1_i1.p1 TRINITY_DN82072_c0_g1~~TRINITY_DN82072_c0_g1_i1.p1  ORF type:complete len:557 (+),score=160.69 TRINITY_DN82072_c0_g1_i1:113-1783(+)
MAEVPMQGDRLPVLMQNIKQETEHPCEQEKKEGLKDETKKGDEPEPQDIDPDMVELQETAKDEDNGEVLDNVEGEGGEDDLKPLPDLDFGKTKIPSVDAAFDLVEEVLDTTTYVNNDIVKLVKQFLATVETTTIESGDKASAEENKPKTMYERIKDFIQRFIMLVKAALSDITACMPEIDLSGVKDGKISVTWPEMDFSKLGQELRDWAQKCWTAMKDMLDGIVARLRDGFAKVPELLKDAKEQINSFGFMKLATEAKNAFSSMDDVKQATQKAKENFNIFKGLDGFMTTFAKNVSVPMLAVGKGFTDGLKKIQEEVFAKAPVPTSKGWSLPKFHPPTPDPNSSLEELPNMNVRKVGIEMVDEVFAKLKAFLDAVKELNNGIIANVKAAALPVVGGLRDEISKLVEEMKDAFKKPGLFDCLGGGTQAKVDVKWKQLQKGNITLKLPKLDLDKLSGATKEKAQKLMNLVTQIIEAVKVGLSKAMQEMKALIQTLKGFTPKNVQAVVKKECSDPAVIPHKVQMFLSNLDIAQIIKQCIALLFQNIINFTAAVKEGFVR